MELQHLAHFPIPTFILANGGTRCHQRFSLSLHHISISMTLESAFLIYATPYVSDSKLCKFVQTFDIERRLAAGISIGGKRCHQRFSLTRLEHHQRHFSLLCTPSTALTLPESLTHVTPCPKVQENIVHM